MKIGREKGGFIAWHGTDRTDFASFDVSCAAPDNIGLHFGTRTAALDRLAYLGRARTPSAPSLRAQVTRLIDDYMLADSRRGKAYLAYCRRLNTDIIYPDCNMICGDIQDEKIFESVRKVA